MPLSLLFSKYNIPNSYNIYILAKDTLKLKYSVLLCTEGMQIICTVQEKNKSTIRWIERSSSQEWQVDIPKNILWHDLSGLKFSPTHSFIVFIRQKFCTFITTWLFVFFFKYISYDRIEIYRTIKMTVNHQSAVCHLTTLVNLTFIPPLIFIQIFCWLCEGYFSFLSRYSVRTFVIWRYNYVFFLLVILLCHQGMETPFRIFQKHKHYK